MTRFALCLALAACATGDIGPDVAAPHTEDTVPIGSYLGSDDVTADRVFALMQAHGIAVIAYGSLGYTIAAPASRADEARQLLRDAIAHDQLQASVYP